MHAVELTRVRRSYGDRPALAGVDLAIPRGALFGLIGPNGAGKSTCLGLIVTLLPPSAGRVTVCGHDVVAAPLEVRRRLGYAPEEPPLLAAPVLVYSSAAGAAWLLRAGVVPAEALARAARGLLRVVFVAPVLLVVVVGYRLAEVPWPSLVAHTVTLALLAEAALRGAQRLLPGLPFSRPPDDDHVAQAMVAMIALAWSMCLLLGALVVHLVYRHWAAIVAFDLYLLLALAQMASPRGRAARA